MKEALSSLTQMLGLQKKTRLTATLAAGGGILYLASTGVVPGALAAGIAAGIAGLYIAAETFRPSNGKDEDGATK